MTVPTRPSPGSREPGSREPCPRDPAADDRTSGARRAGMHGAPPRTGTAPRRRGPRAYPQPVNRPPHAGVTVLRRSLRAAGALAALCALLIGLPTVLVAAAGWPLPRAVPTGTQLHDLLTGPGLPDAVLIDTLACLGWICWAVLLLSTVVEVLAVTRHMPTPRLPALYPAQALIGALVAALALAPLLPAPTGALALGRPPSATAVSGDASRLGSPAPGPSTSNSSAPGLSLAAASAPASRPAADNPAEVDAPNATSVSAARSAMDLSAPDARAAARSAAHPTGHLTLLVGETAYTYPVRPGDSLWEIAGACLGDPHRWPEIYRLNVGNHFTDPGGTLTDPDLIYPGWRLQLPDDARPPATATPNAAAGPADPSTGPPPAPAPEPPHASDPAPGPDLPLPPTTRSPAPSHSPQASNRPRRALPGTTPPGIVPSPGTVATVPPEPATSAASETTAGAEQPAELPSTPSPHEASNEAPHQPADRPAGPPAASPGDPAPSASRAPEQGSASSGVDVPGGWIPLPFAAALVAATGLAWRRRRRRLDAPSPAPGRDPLTDLDGGLDPDEAPALPPTVLAARREVRRNSHELAPRPIDITVREAAQARRDGRPAPPAPATGPDGPTLAGLPSPPPTDGLGLTGPGADAAARALIVATLAAGGPHDGDAQGRIIIPRGTWARLMSPAATPASTAGQTALTLAALETLPRLGVAADLDDALTHLETELVTRRRLLLDADVPDVAHYRRDPDHEPLQTVLLLTDPPTSAAATTDRLAATTSLGAGLAAATVVLGPWPHGDTLTVTPDGHADGSPGSARRRLAVLDADSTAQTLSALVVPVPCAAPEAPRTAPARQAPAAGTAIAPPQSPARPPTIAPHTPTASPHNAAPPGIAATPQSAATSQSATQVEPATPPSPAPPRPSAPPDSAPRRPSPTASPSRSEQSDTAPAPMPAPRNHHSPPPPSSPAATTARSTTAPSTTDRFTVGGGPTHASHPEHNGQTTARPAAPARWLRPAVPDTGHTGRELPESTTTAPPRPSPTRPSTTSTMRVSIRVLGRPAILMPDGAAVGSLREAALELLVYLALHRDGAPLEDIKEAIYPDATRERARQRLSTDVSNLRGRLRHALDAVDDPSTASAPNSTNATPPSTHRAADPVINTGGRYHLNPALLDIDWWRVQDAVRHAKQASTPAEQATALKMALADYHGPLADDRDYEWATHAQQHTRRLGTGIHTKLADLTATTDPRAAAHLLEAACDLDPYDEDLARRSLQALARLGDITTAKTRVRRLRAALDELDESPDTHTEEVIAQALAASSRPPTPGHPPSNVQAASPQAINQTPPAPHPNKGASTERHHP